MSLSAVRCQNQSTALIPLDRTQTFPVRHAFHLVWSKIESMAESWGRSRARTFTAAISDMDLRSVIVMNST